MERKRRARPGVTSSRSLEENSNVEILGLRGHVDFRMLSEDLGMLLGGWISPARAMAGQLRVSLDAADHGIGNPLTVFYDRPDLDESGMGFLILLQPGPDWKDFKSIHFEGEGISGSIARTGQTRELQGSQAYHWLENLLGNPKLISPNCLRERDKLLPAVMDAHRRFRIRHHEFAAGPLDFYGFHAASGGWFFSGWITPGVSGPLSRRARLMIGEEACARDAVVLAFERPDLPDGAVGVIAFVEAARVALTEVTAVAVETQSGLCWMRVGAATQAVRESELVSRLRPVVTGLDGGEGRDELLAVLNRRPYSGSDTMTALDGLVRLEIDEVIACGPNGLLLMGWCLAKPNAIRDIRVRCGGNVQPLDLALAVPVKRPDVIEALGKEGFDDPACGFIAFVPVVLEADAHAYIEVRTRGFAVGYRPLAPHGRAGLEAIKRLLGAFELRFGDIASGYDNVVGPAVQRLNAQRLARKSEPKVIEFGTCPDRPRFSVIIPLYGRIDFAEYQLALFSQHPANAEVEFLFVLDQPERRVEAQQLFASIHARFQLPCRLVLLAENLGYGPANNVGLRLARGCYVVFLNSDVFPGTADWLERLAARLEADAQLGMIGPMLLFEDDSVQHRGMDFERLPEFGNWWFCGHVDKGRKYEGSGEIGTWPSITGACMMMERTLATELGGFDEAYAIGDFEDADFCLRVIERGRKCAIDPGVRLYHLERRSQLSPGLTWRMNLTLYNAWVFQGRWAPAVAALMGEDTIAGAPSQPGDEKELAA